MAEDRAVAVHDPKDAHEVAAALLRLADAADARGKVAFLDETRRRELAQQLHRLAETLDPDGRPFEALVALYAKCPACGGLLPLGLSGNAEKVVGMRCGCGRTWELGLRLR